MAYIDVLNECVSKGLDKNLTHFYIAELWAATNKQRGNTKDFEEKIIKAVIDGELIAEASVTNPKALGGYEVIPYSPTILSQFENGFIDGSNGRRVAILQLYIARDDFRAWFKKSKQRPVADDCLLTKWFEDEQQAETMGDAGEGNQATKQRKKLKPLERETNEGLLLLYEIFKHYEVEYLDELQAIKAWGKIISKEFTSDLIKEISDAKKSITLSGGEKLGKIDFTDKYRKRFE